MESFASADIKYPPRVGYSIAIPMGTIPMGTIPLGNCGERSYLRALWGIRPQPGFGYGIQNVHTG